MTAGLPEDQWTVVRSFFHQAIDLPPSGRPDFLASISDSSLRTEVELLLSTAGGLDSKFLAGPALALPSTFADHLIASQQNQPFLGSVLKGRYRIEQFLAQGGQGTVWLACDLQMEYSRVAIKILSGAEEHASWLRRRFAEEWGALSALQHPNVVRVRDFGDIEGVPFFVMEYVAGETLRQRFTSGLPSKSIAAIIRQIGAALSAAHQLGICHRDLKPENVIVSEEMAVKLIDFGIAQIERQETGATVTVFMMAGTTRYMAPEQFLGVASPKSDIYSLAIVIYEMLAARCPYAAEGALEIARAQRHRPIRTILQETREIPRRLVPTLAAALALDPDQRPDDAARFAGEVAEIILEPKLSFISRLRRTSAWLRRSVPLRFACPVLLLGVLAWWAASVWQEAHIVTVIETANASDPSTDGFRPHNDVSGTVAYNDDATGLEAWIVSTSSQGHYHRPLSDAQKKVALKNGWTLKMIAKTLEGQAYTDVDFAGRGPLFLMDAAVLRAKLTARGCTRLAPKFEFTDAELNLDPAAYHEYRMTYDPGSKSAQIAVDGKVVITGYRGINQYQDNLGADFGCERFQSRSGKAAFKLVRFQISGRNQGSS